ncbi:hypothetical protein LEP1GSC058_1170 [Leptospira fainei serovar Hurstbridge str. BUT 6]|uniref:Uncharacterized protein n=1 Tax=Leptospira fainei serovar Hurstbridge str. BUT 6 TaxID=1193011 RepID=S3VWS8_9LEPT|nr:hypothetical protein [Leptospira fainei]EPG72572.1 hypothetical protein LEP1GSC058_1170 [Leptospira fainei serovar Hurstbridge str. BUT 6]
MYFSKIAALYIIRKAILADVRAQEMLGFLPKALSKPIAKGKQMRYRAVMALVWTVGVEGDLNHGPEVICTFK